MNPTLTEKQVREIHTRYAAGGVTQTALAAEYAVSPAAVGKIVSGESWRHLNLADLRPDQGAATWAVQVTGAFEGTWSTHRMPCPNETIARNRTTWWREYRSDVIADVVNREAGRAWQVTR